MYTTPLRFQYSIRIMNYTGFPSSGLKGSVFLRREQSSFVVNVSVRSHRAIISLAPYIDLQSLRQLQGCQFGLQLIKLNNTKKKVDINELLNRNQAHYYKAAHPDPKLNSPL